MLLIAALLAVLLSFGINRVGGRGPCFGNLAEGLLAREYVRALEQGDWETAAGLWRDPSYVYYNAIHSSLSRSVEELTPKFRPVAFDGSFWYIRDSVKGSDVQRAMLNTLLYISGEGMFTEDDLQFHLRNHGYFEIDGYSLRTTPWGESYLPETIQDSMDPLELGRTIDLMPKHIYLEVMPLLEEQARTSRDTLLAHYGPPEELTEEKCNQIILSDYIAGLEALEAQSISFQFEAVPDFWVSASRREKSSWSMRISRTPPLGPMPQRRP